MKRQVWIFGIAVVAGVLFLGVFLVQGNTAPNAMQVAKHRNATPTYKTICLSLNATKPETNWANALSKRLGGSTEVPVDHGRVDVLTSHFAIEVDWLRNFKNGMGQAQYYGMETGRLPALAVIVKPEQLPLRALAASHLAKTEKLSVQRDIHLFVLYEQSTCPVAAPEQTAMR